MRKPPAIMICIFCTSVISGQSIYYPLSVPYVSSAKIAENFTNGMNAAFNPSVIPYLKNIEAGMYAEKKYLTDIDLLLLSLCVPFNNNGVALLFQHFGNSEYNEKILGLNYGKNFGTINAGILFQSVSVKIRGSANTSFIQAGISSSVKISDNISAGIKILNPRFLAKAEKDKVRAASSFSLVMAWHASPVAYAGLELKKDEGRPLSLIFTLQYQFAEKFSGGLNWSTSYNQPFICIGWKLTMLNIEAGCSYHAILGLSPSISLIYKKNPRN